MKASLLVVLVVLVAVLGALAAYLVGRGPAPTSVVAPEGRTAKIDDAPAAVAAPEKAPEPAKKTRSRAAAPETPTLAVAGVVTSGDKPVAGAVVECYAVPAADDVSDEDRVGRAMMAKLFGKQGGERMWEKTKKMRGAGGSPDASKIADIAQASIDVMMDAFSEDGGAAFGSIAELARRGRLDDDGDWTKVGAAATDAEGRFRIEGLAAGRVELRAKAPRHVKSKVRANAGDAAVAIGLVEGAGLAGVVTRKKEDVVGATIVIKGAQTTSGAGGRFEFDAAHVPYETVMTSAPGCVAQIRTVAVAKEGATKDVEIDLEPAGVVAGHVKAATGEAIAGARVSLASSDNPLMDMMGMGGGSAVTNLPPAPAATDEAGAFELQGVHAGAVKIRVEADGFLATSVPVNVVVDQTVAADAVLVRESKLSGFVKDEAGAPIVGARVRVEVPPPDATMGMIAAAMGGSFRSALADEKGAFVVNGLAEGDRKVRVEAAKYLTLEDKVAVPAQATTTRDFTLHPGLKLSGTVAGPDGKPYAGAKVYVTGKSPGGMAAMAAMFGGGGAKDAAAESDADGKWAADGLQEGPFNVKATATGFLDGEAKRVEAGRTDVALTLGAAATIRGVVVGPDMQPVGGATVRSVAGDGAKKSRGGFAAMFGGGAGDSTTCKDDGSFVLTGLVPGAYALTGTMHGYADSESANVTVGAGETSADVQLVLQTGVNISGRVVEKGSGAPLEGAVVWASKSDNPFASMATDMMSGGAPKAPSDSISATSDADGRFVLAGLNSGKITVEARAAEHAPTSLAGVAAPTADLAVEMSAGGSVAGRVTGADGAPVAEAQVMIMRGMMGQGMRQTKSGGDGEFLFEHVAPGTMTIMLVDMKNPMAPAMASVVVKDGETVRHDFAKKTAAGRKVEVRVMRDGKPLSGAMVVVSGPGGMKTGTTDDAGRPQIDDLPPGEYTVMVQSSMMGGGSTSKKVTVGPDGKLDEVRLELSSASVEGDVLDAVSGAGVAGAQITLTEPGAKMGSASEMMANVRGQAFTDERGHFLISNVQNGAFTLRATAADYVPGVLDGVASNSTGLKVQLHRGFEFVVTVLDAEGHGVAGATVKSTDASGHETMAFDMTMSGITKQDGTAHLRLAPGRYAIDVAADGMVPAHVEVDTAAGPATVVLAVGATLELSVVDGAGNAVAGAKVVVKDAAGKEVSRGLVMSSFFGGDVTDTNGRYTRAGLPSGAVTVVVTAPGRDPTSVETSLDAGKTRHVDVAAK